MGEPPTERLLGIAESPLCTASNMPMLRGAADGPADGLLYGGGGALLGTQLLGVAAVGAWALGAGLILFKALQATVGLRVSRQVEEEGLDGYEHGETAYDL